MTEEYLAGNIGGAVRVGDTVRRATGAWTPAVHALLRHLESRLPLVPRVLVGCSDGSPSANPPAAGSTTAGSPAAAATTAARSTGITPDQVCGLVDTAQMSQFTGFTITSTKPEMSGNVAVCHYEGSAGDNFVASKVLLEYQPDGEGAVEFTKARGEAVSGLGTFAVYFSTAAQLSVEPGGADVFHVFIQDTRAHGSDPKTAAVQIAGPAVPRLPHS